MSNSNHAGMFTGESLLKMGRSLRILAITVIVILSAGIAILVYGQLRQTSPSHRRDPQSHTVDGRIRRDDAANGRLPGGQKLDARPLPAPAH